MSLNDPTSKMSKSNKSERSRILITDNPEEIKTKIASALTDSTPGITYDMATRPGISNLLDILSIFDAEGRNPERLAEHFADVSPRQLKEVVADAVVTGLKGIRERYLTLLDSRDNHLDTIAKEGARKAQKSSKETMCLVRGAIGF
jgi:tryptophanyl-tRNA synthetase